MSRGRLGVVALLVLIVIVAMMLTSNAMSELRIAIPPLSESMSWLESLDLPFDMDHVAFFTGVTFVVRLLLPRVRWWWIALAVVLLAGVTEMIQFQVPGRTPKLLDARDDMLGGAIGLLLASVLIRGACIAQAWVSTIGQRIRGLARKGFPDE